jgi:hypothetical protein
MHLTIVQAGHGKRGRDYFYRFEADQTLTTEDVEELRDQFLKFKETQVHAAFKFAGLQVGGDNRTIEFRPVVPAALVDELGSVAIFRALCEWLDCENVACYALEPSAMIEQIADGFVLRRAS